MEITGSTSDSSSDGLKFGKKIYFEDVGNGVSAKSSGGSSSVVVAKGVSVMGKRGRGVLHSGQPPRCQVEGCDLDLSGAKAYYARHKVCGMHSKSPVVVVAGLEQRFCQQCSRFHRLPEFDQGKRSCRRRLAGHNERRRKPPPESSLSLRYGRLFSSLQEESSRMGSSLMDFTTYPIFPGGNLLSVSRSGDCIPGNQPISTGKSFPHVWHGNSENPNFFSDSSQSYLQSSTGGMVISSSEIPSGEYFSGVSDSSRALSLLSFQPWDPTDRVSGLALNNLMASGGAQMTQLAGPHCVASNSFTSNAWGYNVNEGSSSNKSPSNSDLAQAPQSINTHLSSQLEIAKQGSKQYMEHWYSRAYGSSSR